MTGMAARPDGWTVDAGVDFGVAHAVLAQDRIANGYAIADLEPPFDAYTTVAVARYGEAEPAAACQVLRHPDLAAIVTHGDARGIDAILSVIELPPAAHLAIQAAHLPHIGRRYRLIDRSERSRMAVDAGTFRPAGELDGVVRLGPPDVPALCDLYAGYAESAFMPAQVEAGVFYGVWDGVRLLAAGGTHAVAPRSGLAAVGNIFTRSEARGHGYATAVTSAVAAELLALGCKDVFLNVGVANHTAIRVYERLGFHTHNRYWEARGELRHMARRN